ncbi:unnamed protein product [Arabidopsis halleri]
MADAVVVCPSCDLIFNIGEDQMIFDIQCECSHEFCGKCFQANHYPALCLEYSLWQNLRAEDADPVLLADPLLQGRMTDLVKMWDELYKVIDFADDVEAFADEPYCMFREHLHFLCQMLRKAASFSMWLHLHCMFNPAVHALLAPEMHLLRGRLAIFGDSIPDSAISASLLPQTKASVTYKCTTLLGTVVQLLLLLSPVRTEVREVAPGGVLDASEAEILVERLAAEVAHRVLVSDIASASAF